MGLHQLVSWELQYNSLCLMESIIMKYFKVEFFLGTTDQFVPKWLHFVSCLGGLLPCFLCTNLSSVADADSASNSEF